MNLAILHMKSIASRALVPVIPEILLHLKLTHIGRRRHIDPGIDWFLEAANILKNSKLTYTRPVCGAFMDFLGMPHARSNIAPMNIVVDVLNRQACIPGDGNTPITMIYSYDAATLVAKLLEVDEWSEFSFCNGDDTTLSEVLRTAEEICGEYSFLKRYEVCSNSHAI